MKRLKPLVIQDVAAAALMSSICTPTLAATAIAASALPPAAVRMESRAVTAGEGMQLILSTRLNQRDFGLQPVRLLNDQVQMQASVLSDMGLKAQALTPLRTDAPDWVTLSQIQDAQVQYRADTQSLELTVPFSQLDWAQTELITQEKISPRASASRGLALSYDLYGSQVNGQRGLNAFTELRAFQANGVVSNTMLSQYVSGGDQAILNNRPSQNLRLDTSYTQSYPDCMVTVRVGDMVTAALPWTRATRMGGIQIGRNFGLQPYRVTTPVPAFMGTSALPSDIALYMDGVRQYQGSVPSGPFTLNAPTGISGQGNAQVVLTDAFGRTTTLQYSFYGSNRLLAKGLSDWSAELGWVRRNYGKKSFDYGADPVAMGSWSYGLSDNLTVQSHSEISANFANAGAGALWRWGSAGVFSAAASGSQHQSRTGHQLQLGYSWSNSRYYVDMQATKASNAFRDAASLYDTTRAVASGRSIVGYNAKNWGSFNVGAMYLRNLDQTAQRYLTAGWSRTVGNSGYINFNINHNLDRSRDSSVQLLVSWYLDNKVSTGASISQQNGHQSVNAFANQTAPSEGGWGWSTVAQAGSGGSAGSNSNAQGRVDYRGDQWEANAGIAHANGNTSVGAGLSGSVVLMGGHFFASRRINDSFAVVSTNGIAGVPIKRENIVIGHSDKNGMLLVPQLGAYRENTIGIDPMALPAQMQIPETNQAVVPTDRSGVLVHFDIQPIHAATIVLHGENGQPLPIGSTVLVKNADQHAQRQLGRSSMVGYDGATYFEQLPDHGMLIATQPDGRRCQTAIHWPDQQPANEIPVIGPLLCHATSR